MDPINPIAGNPEALNPNPQVSQTPKDSHGITIGALAIFILLALTAVAFLYYQNQQLKSMLASYQTPAAPPTPAATADPTANWKAYINEKYGYTFKYPSDWQINSSSDKLVENNLVTLSVAGYKIKFYSNLTGVGGGQKDVSYSSIILDGMNLYETQNGDNLIDKTSSVGITDNPKSFGFTKNGTVYDISFTFPTVAKDTHELDMQNQTFHQILSTFKFTETSATPSSSPLPSLLPQ